MFSADKAGNVNWSATVQAPYAGDDARLRGHPERTSCSTCTNMVADMDRIRAGGVHFGYDSNAAVLHGRACAAAATARTCAGSRAQNLFCTHVMGGWSDGDKVTVDWDGGEGNQFPFFPSMHEPFDPAKSHGLLRRFTIDLSSKSNDRYQVETIFPEVTGVLARQDDRFHTLPYRYGYLNGFGPRGGWCDRRPPGARPAAGLGARLPLREMTFVPRKKDAPEGDGYLIGIGSQHQGSRPLGPDPGRHQGHRRGAGRAGQDAVQGGRPGPRLLGRRERHSGRERRMSLACWPGVMVLAFLLLLAAAPRRRRSQAHRAELRRHPALSRAAS